jgi:hypothetical protein
MICLAQTSMKIHHASSIRPIKNKLFTDENAKVNLINVLPKSLNFIPNLSYPYGISSSHLSSLLMIDSG